MENATLLPLGNLCRTCLATTTDLREISSTVNVENTVELTLNSMLLQCTELYVSENDDFPQGICSLCCEKLIQAFKFRQTCHRSLNKLRQVYENNKNNSVETVIEEAMFYPCPNCDKTFNSKYTLNRHKKTHNENDGSLKCKICLKTFSRSTDVKRHMHIHTGEKPYVCFMCETSFNQSGTLTQHLRRTHHMNIQSSNNKKTGLKKSHLCSICGKSFKDSSSLTVHIRRHIGDKPYSCKVCSMKFVSSGRLTSHMRIHTGERPFVCNVCGKSFAQSSVIAKHMKTHSGVKPYTCDICLKAFTTLYYLKIHKRLHTGEKPHECDICHKTFSDPKNLKHHKMIHTNIKPYLCVICGKGFRRGHHLKNHMNIHMKN